MKASEFQKYLRGTAVYMKTLVMATSGYGQLTSNVTYFSGSWFSGAKNAEESMAAGVDYCRLAKTSHKGFCLSTLEKLMKDWTGGSYLVMKSTPGVPCGRTRMTIRLSKILGRS